MTCRLSKLFKPGPRGSEFMLAAELHGKISDGNISNRMEDVLTAYVMSLFRYLNNLLIPLA
jgi:hypothetical protein